MMRYPVAVLMVGLAAMPTPAFGGHPSWAKMSDWHGDLQAAESLAAAGGTTFVLKELIHERRLDDSDGKSFPSGHPSVSFAAAATLENRYGSKAGLPALVVDAVTMTLGLGYLVGTAMVGAALASIEVLFVTNSTSRVALFWSAFILTRPLGATVGDFLDKPVDHDGLAFRRPLASLLLRPAIVALIVLPPQRAGRSDVR